MKGLEGVVIREYENGRDGVEIELDEGKEGPDDESVGCSPDDEEEIVCDVFEISEASDRG